MPSKPEVYQTYLKEHRSKLINNGKCRCGRTLLDGYKYCEVCVDKDKIKTKERNAFRRKNGLCLLCGQSRDLSQTRCSKCILAARNYLLRLKLKVFTAYGNKCACCGGYDIAINQYNHIFLTIDHINDDGHKHRKAIGSNRVYNWLVKNSYPKHNFRLLCWNCNCGRKTNGGICLHETIHQVVWCYDI